MMRFLKDHFQYPTINSWNQSISYVCNLKDQWLGLEGENETQLYDVTETQEFFVFRIRKEKKQ